MASHHQSSPVEGANSPQDSTLKGLHGAHLMSASKSAPRDQATLPTHWTHEQGFL